MDTFDMAGGFNFQGTPVDTLGASQYTLVTIVLDETGSTRGFEKTFREMLLNSIYGCQKSPFVDNLLVRVILFSTSYHPNGVRELHGFKPLSEIDVTNYPLLTGGGMTPLTDAVYSAVGATNAYAKQLYDSQYTANGITIVVTDGGDNESTATMQMIKDELEKSVSGEVLESHISILVGVDTGNNAAPALAKFKDEAGITQFIDAGEATPRKLAKLAEFVSQSVSSQAQAGGTGGPSQNIAATI